MPLSVARRHLFRPTRAVLVLLAASLVAGIVVTGSASAAASSVAPVSPAVKAAVDAAVAAGMPGVVVRVDVGGAVQSATAGTADIATGADITPSARFRVGSLTKTYVATVVLQLVGEKRVVLDCPIEHYLPGLLNNGKRITVRQLLNHTSGVPDYTQDPSLLAGITSGRVYTPRELIALGNSMPRSHAPGTRWSYSNTNYIVAGLLVEKVTGRKLATVLENRIFRPLNLTHTSFATVTPAGTAHGYVPAQWSPAQDGRPYDVTAVNASHAWAAGAIVSNVSDVSTFYRALFSGRLLAPAQLRAMKTTVAQDPKDPQSTFRYGLGIERVRDTCGVNWGLGGAIFGYSTAAYYNERTGRTFVIAATMSPPSPSAAPAMAELTNTLAC